MITYRYFYDREERARRAYMLFAFSEGLKEANRSVFVDTYTNYYFTKWHGQSPGAEAIVPAQLLEELDRVHQAARTGRRLTQSERRRVFETSLLFEQEMSVGPKVKAEVAKVDCGPRRSSPATGRCVPRRARQR
jgi:hypothetical protein